MEIGMVRALLGSSLNAGLTHTNRAVCYFFWEFTDARRRWWVVRDSNLRPID